MGTVRDLLHQSALLVGLRAAGEVLDATLAQDCLTVLNQMIDAWALEELLVYFLDRQVLTMTVLKQQYTLGPGGDLPIVRPVRIEAANWRDEAQVPALELPLGRLQRQQYHNLRVRELTSALPTRFYYEPGWPLGVLFLHPSPTQSKKIVLWVWHPWSVSSVDQLDDVLSLPPGYERLLVHALAVDLGQQPGARLTPQTVKIAMEARQLVESLNASIPVLQMPHGLFGRKVGSYSYYDHISQPE